jgi:fatty-acyl-CoA synthase
MPLTGVGKVFKPKLRWDAAERVFGVVLGDLATAGRQIAVNVGADGTHGSIATIRVGGVPAYERAALEAEIAGRMAPFVMRHRVTWA